MFLFSLFFVFFVFCFVSFLFFSWSPPTNSVILAANWTVMEMSNHNYVSEKTKRELFSGFVLKIE